MSSAKELAIELKEIREQIKDLRMREDEVEQTLAEEMERDALVLEGIGIFERKRANNRKNWDTEGLRYELLKKMPDIGRLVAGTGQIESEAEAFGRVLADAARFDWRTTRLRYYDIDADQWCEKTPGRYQIKMMTVQ